jgi:hypothetical protein
MTSTKLVVFIAAVVPFGLVAIAIYAFVLSLRHNKKSEPDFEASRRSDFGSSGRQTHALFQQGRCIFLR